MTNDWQFVPVESSKKKQVPTAAKLTRSVVIALEQLGGIGTNSEIFAKVVELEKIPSEIAEIFHIAGPKTLLEYRLAWARTCLKKDGIIENIEIGKWGFKNRSKHL